MKKQILFLLLFPILILGQDIYYLHLCNFDDSCSVVQLDTLPSNIWQIGTPSKVLFDSSYSPNKALVTDTLNYYPINNHSTFEIHLAEAPQSVEIYFKYKIDTDSLKDGFYIDLLYDTTIGWISATDSFPSAWGDIPLAHCFDNLYTLDDTLYNGYNGLSGSSNGWQDAKINIVWEFPIKEYSEIIDTLIFRFNFISDSVETNQEGMMIDDIRVVAPILGTINESIQSNFKIYPNPTKEQFTIETPSKIFGESNKLSYKIVNILEKEIQHKRINNTQTTVSVQNIATGIYTLVIYDNNQPIFNQKIVRE